MGNGRASGAKESLWKTGARIVVGFFLFVWGVMGVGIGINWIASGAHLRLAAMLSYLGAALLVLIAGFDQLYTAFLPMRQDWVRRILKHPLVRVAVIIALVFMAGAGAAFAPML